MVEAKPWDWVYAQDILDALIIGITILVGSALGCHGQGKSRGRGVGAGEGRDVHPRCNGCAGMDFAQRERAAAGTHPPTVMSAVPPIKRASLTKHLPHTSHTQT